MKNLIFIVDEDLQDEPSTEEIITTLISDGEEIPLENTVKKESHLPLLKETARQKIVIVK